MSSGTQISDMTDALTVFPDGAFVPFVVEVNVGGLITTVNYRYNAGLYLAKYSVLAEDDGASLIGYIYTSPLAVSETLETRVRRLPPTPEDEGASGAGTGDQSTEIQSLIDYLSGLGGGTVLGTPGATYRCTTAPIVSDNVTLDLNGATLVLALSGGNDYGVRLRTNAYLCNGTITVQSSGSGISAQAGVHAPITIGPIYGDGGTAASPSDDQFVSGWSVRNMTLSSDKWVLNDDGKHVGSSGIQLMGGVNNGIIENITIPDNARMLAGISADWNYVGTLSSTDTAAVQNANKVRYDAGTAYQTYPNNITIRDINIGNLSALLDGQDTGSYGVRLSGVYQIEVSQVKIAACTNQAFRYTVGDLGREFATAAERPLVSQNVSFDGGLVVASGTAGLGLIDTFADNIARAVDDGYVSMVNPLVHSSVTIDNLTGTGPNNSTATYGLRIQTADGVTARCINASGYKQGINVDELTRNIIIESPTCTFNREHGIVVDHNGDDPEDILIRGAICNNNGQNGAFSNPVGIYIGNSLRVKVRDCLLGQEGAADPTQVIGIRCTDAGVSAEFENNNVLSAKTITGTGYSIMSGTSFNLLRLFRDNQWNATYVALPYSGLTVIPVSRETTEDDRTITSYVMDKSVTPTGLSLANGDIIRISDPAPGGLGALVCVSGGTVGTDAVLGPLPAGGFCAVADLPAANALHKGLTSFVTNSNAPLADTSVGNTVAGGGSDFAPVFCDGTNWRIG